MHVEAGEGQGIDVDRTVVRIRGIAVDPKKGARFDSAKLEGTLKKDGEKAGRFELYFGKSFDRDDNLITKVNLKSEDIDLAAIRFIYKDSLPVEVEKGIMELIQQDVYPERLG